MERLCGGGQTREPGWRGCSSVDMLMVREHSSTKMEAGGRRGREKGEEGRKEWKGGKRGPVAGVGGQKTHLSSSATFSRDFCVGLTAYGFLYELNECFTRLPNIMNGNT